MMLRVFPPVKMIKRAPAKKVEKGEGLSVCRAGDLLSWPCFSPGNLCLESIIWDLSSSVLTLSVGARTKMASFILDLEEQGRLIYPLYCCLYWYRGVTVLLPGKVI
jgi:hypothetical protein